MAKQEPRDRRSILNAAIMEFGSLPKGFQKKQKKVLLKNENCIKIATKAAEIAGFNINDDEDVRAFLHLICINAFTDLPKGVNAKGWNSYVPIIQRAAGLAKDIEGGKFSLLLKALRSERSSNPAKEDAANRQRITRAYAAVKSAYPKMKATDKKSIKNELAELERFMTRKTAKRVAKKRGAYRKV